MTFFSCVRLLSTEKPQVTFPYHFCIACAKLLGNSSTFSSLHPTLKTTSSALLPKQGKKFLGILGSVNQTKP